MKTAIHHGAVSVHRSGGVGSQVTIRITGEVDGEWDGIYRFGSHGMSVDDFHARVAELKAYHAAKMKRLNGFRDLKMRDILEGGAKHRIIEANIIERGEDVELRLGVYLINSLGFQFLAFTMDHKNGLIFPNVDAIPDDDAIERIVRMRIRSLNDVISTHDRFKTAVIGIVEA